MSRLINQLIVSDNLIQISLVEKMPAKIIKLGDFVRCSDGRYRASRERAFKLPWRKADLLKSSRSLSGFGPVGRQFGTFSLQAVHVPTRQSE